jgi:hypothetical protein
MIDSTIRIIINVNQQTFRKNQGQNAMTHDFTGLDSTLFLHPGGVRLAKLFSLFSFVERRLKPHPTGLFSPEPTSGHTKRTKHVQI